MNKRSTQDAGVGSEKEAVGCTQHGKEWHSNDYLKWLCYTHNGAHVVAIVTHDKVP